MTNKQRIHKANELYDVLAHLSLQPFGQHSMKGLGACNGGMNWPKGGVYFFFESSELRMDGRTQRVVRVGTHALPNRNGFGVGTLWSHLSLHRSGNTAASAFRRAVSVALGNGGEDAISAIIRPMPFLVLPVDEMTLAGAQRRKEIEEFCILLLSNWVVPLDPPSRQWLGLNGGPKVAASGLWQSDDVDQDPAECPIAEADRIMDMIRDLAG